MAVSVAKVFQDESQAVSAIAGKERVFRVEHLGVTHFAAAKDANDCRIRFTKFLGVQVATIGGPPVRSPADVLGNKLKKMSPEDRAALRALLEAQP